jgi:hypothetical protein
MSAEWVKCEGGCGDYWCLIHEKHAFECECPTIDCWETSPYGEDERGEHGEEDEEDRSW